MIPETGLMIPDLDTFDDAIADTKLWMTSVTLQGGSGLGCTSSVYAEGMPCLYSTSFLQRVHVCMCAVCAPLAAPMLRVHLPLSSVVIHTIHRRLHACGCRKLESAPEDTAIALASCS